MYRLYIVNKQIVHKYNPNHSHKSLFLKIDIWFLNSYENANTLEESHNFEEEQSWNISTIWGDFPNGPVLRLHFPMHGM